MAWEKIVRRLTIGLVCPACRTEGFDYQPGADPGDEFGALVQCPECGWKGTLGDLDVVSMPPSPE